MDDLVSRMPKAQRNMTVSNIAPFPEPGSKETAVDPLMEARVKMHRQMLSSVSHDLKTPLASIIGSLEVFERMKDKLSEDKQKSLIVLALQEAYRLDSFVTNILDMAKFDNDLVKAQKEVTPIGSVVKNCLARFSRRPQSCTLTVDAVAEVNAATDPILLCQALTLVLDNAIKHGGSPAVINVRYGQDNGHAFIEVRDQGPGIAPERLETIFSKYTRFATQDKQGAGTGLGLAICRKIMDLLGGKITAANSPQGQGAVFALSLPLA